MDEKPLMTEPEFDSHGYPTEKTLETIQKWPLKMVEECFNFIRKAWKYENCFTFDESTARYEISTGGWSGNEELIGAMRGHLVLWSLCWVSSERGGHFVFELPEYVLKERELNARNVKESESD